MATEGFKELSAKLSKMGKAAGGKVLRSAALSAMLPALRAAQAAIPVGQPPYESGDPYPVKTYKGRLRTPGFAKRSIKRKSLLTRDRTTAIVLLGVVPEAFYAVSFYELGTSIISRKPWLVPSFRNSLPAIDTRLADRLKFLIDKAAL